MTTQETPRLTDKELDILEELWNTDPDWAKDSLLVLRDLRAARERSEALKAVLAAAGITGWVTAPDGTIEPQYDTDDEEDVRTPEAQLTALREAVAPFVAEAEEEWLGYTDEPDDQLVSLTISMGNLRALRKALRAEKATIPPPTPRSTEETC